MPGAHGRHVDLFGCSTSRTLKGPSPTFWVHISLIEIFLGRGIDAMKAAMGRNEGKRLVFNVTAPFGGKVS